MESTEGLQPQEPGEQSTCPLRLSHLWMCANARKADTHASSRQPPLCPALLLRKPEVPWENWEADSCPPLVHTIAEDSGREKPQLQLPACTRACNSQRAWRETLAGTNHGPLSNVTATSREEYQSKILYSIRLSKKSSQYKQKQEICNSNSLTNDAESKKIQKINETKSWYFKDIKK